MADKYGPPTLWDCFKDIKNARDVWEFLPLLVPMPIYRAWQWVKHPKSEWAHHRQLVWARTRAYGDWVCDCRGRHLQVADYGNRDPNNRRLSDGTVVDLQACCSPVKADDSCHSYYIHKP